jgi:hypothetical protein
MRRAQSAGWPSPEAMRSHATRAKSTWKSMRHGAGGDGDDQKETIGRQEVKGIERYRQNDRPSVARLSPCGQNVSNWSRQHPWRDVSANPEIRNGKNRLSGSRLIQAAAALNVMPGDILGDNNRTGNNNGHDRFAALAEPAVNLMVRAMNGDRTIGNRWRKGLLQA